MSEQLPRWYGVAAAIPVAGVIGLVASNLWRDARPEPARLISAYVGEQSVNLGVESCNADSHDVQVRESGRAVTIEVRSHGGAENEDCGDTITVVLDHPVGDRALVDGTTGEALVCEDDTEPSPCRHRIASWVTN